MAREDIGPGDPSPATRYGLLVAGLVGHHRRLYRDSPTFHSSVDHLARTLVAIADGLATTSVEEDMRHERALHDLRNSTFGPIPTEWTTRPRSDTAITDHVHSDPGCYRRHVNPRAAISENPCGDVMVTCPCACHPAEVRVLASFRVDDQHDEHWYVTPERAARRVPDGVIVHDDRDCFDLACRGWSSQRPADPHACGCVCHPRPDPTTSTPTE